MYTTTFIKRHIFKLPRRQIFTTRELLYCGLRTAVDQALYRLVKNGTITRLARGIFMLGDFISPLPSVYDVAVAKAKAFCKDIVSHGADAAYKFKLKEKGNTEYIYCINGHSSSFCYGDKRIYFRGISPRKMQGKEGIAGQMLRALWNLGLQECNKLTLTATNMREQWEVSKLSYQELCHYYGAMPGWLNSLLSRSRVYALSILRM